jgi:hypothetical protein
MGEFVDVQVDIDRTQSRQMGSRALPPNKDTWDVWFTLTPVPPMEWGSLFEQAWRPPGKSLRQKGRGFKGDHIVVWCRRLEDAESGGSARGLLETAVRDANAAYRESLGQTEEDS